MKEELEHAHTELFVTKSKYQRLLADHEALQADNQAKATQIQVSTKEHEAELNLMRLDNKKLSQKEVGTRCAKRASQAGRPWSARTPATPCASCKKTCPT